jgi:PIN domain nuclease of toxin-antitoxin system
MKVLLDTCALLALAGGVLPERAAGALGLASEASVSVVSAWEVAIKTAAGKLRMTVPPYQWFRELAERHDLKELPLDAHTACTAAALPALHRDPFDRVVVAVAMQQALTVLTSDRDIAGYPGVTVIW